MINQLKGIRFFYLYVIGLIVIIESIGSSLVHAKKFIIGVEAVRYYPLYDFRDDQMAHPSFTRDLLTAFFTAQHYDFKFVALPLKRFDKWYEEQNIDFKFPDNRRWRDDGGKRLGLIFSAPVVKLMAGSFVLKSRVNELTRDKVTKLATVFGFYPILWADLVNNHQINVLSENSPMSIVKHLLYGNVDVTNIDLNVINYQLGRLNRQGEIVLSMQLPHETYDYYLSTIHFPKVITEFNMFLKNHRQLLKALKQKHHIKEELDE